jgi:hypothetical protein
MIVSSSQKVSQPPLLEKRTVDKDGELALYIVNGCRLSCIYYFTTPTHTHTVCVIWSWVNAFMVMSISIHNKGIFKLDKAWEWELNFIYPGKLCENGCDGMDL